MHILRNLKYPLDSGIVIAETCRGDELKDKG
jgi:hypothetical protein